MTIIYHLTSFDLWNQAVQTNEYRAGSLATEGFIHASTVEQVEASANRFFAKQRSIIVLTIDLEEIRSPVVWEPSTHSPTSFPHIYGPLNVDAVVRDQVWAQRSDGRFHWPPATAF